LAPGLEAIAGGSIPEAADELIPADLYISLNAHLGRPEVLTLWMDPSVTDENDPTAADPALDMYDPANGPPYSPEFVARYRAAQEARNHRITAWVREELLRLASFKMFDRLFTMQRTWADLRLMDGALDPSDRQVGLCYAGDPRWANYSPFGIGHCNSLRTWLSMWSLETSQCRGAPHLAKIEVPALVIQSMADTGVFPSDATTIYEHLGSEDKLIEFVKGDHYLQDPASARDAVADRIANWVEDHPGT
jgi:alpha-beta hydrolase superfamily lysophospholipase